VFEHLPRLQSGRWINIGRLDINTTGLLMFTTDGELANRLMHPSYQMDREYAVRVMGEVDDEMIERLLAGVMLEDGPAKFSDIKKAPGGAGFNHWFHCVVMEGRNREVRRLWESQGVTVSRLKRVRFGPVFLTSDLTVGRWREMVQGEIDILSNEVGLESVALPEMKGKQREKLERMQRKTAKPVLSRSPRRAEGERPARVLRDESGAPIARKPRPSATRENPRDSSKGSQVAERPADMNKKRPAKTSGDRARPGQGERPERKPTAGKRPPAGDGQRPGFGRKRP